MSIEQSSKCKKCGLEISALCNKERTPCPVCSETSRVHSVEVKDVIVFHDQMRIKGKHGGKGKPFFEAKSGDEYYFARSE